MWMKKYTRKQLWLKLYSALNVSDGGAVASGSTKELLDALGAQFGIPHWPKLPLNDIDALDAGTRSEPTRRAAGSEPDDSHPQCAPGKTPRMAGYS